MDSALDWHSARALLEWQVELGATEAICDEPVDRYGLQAKPAAAVAAEVPAAQKAMAAPAVAVPVAVDVVAEARHAAGQATTLEALREALAGYGHCDLHRGARTLVFADGVAGARVMIIGEAPGRDEDLQGKPFVGAAGQLLDRMLAAIGLGRAQADPDQGVYITNILPWRPPQNRDPKPEEIAMMMPFVERHVALAKPDVLVLMGNISCQGVLRQRGITRLRGQWAEAYGLPVLPMFHPAYLLRNPVMKREAWADLLALQAKLSATRAKG